MTGTGKAEGRGKKGGHMQQKYGEAAAVLPKKERNGRVHARSENRSFPD